MTDNEGETVGKKTLPAEVSQSFCIHLGTPYVTVSLGSLLANKAKIKSSASSAKKRDMK